MESVQMYLNGRVNSGAVFTHSLTGAVLSMEIDHSKHWVSPRARFFVAGMFLFVFTAAIFYLSPANQMTDSMYSMLLSETLLRHRSVDLNYAHLTSGGAPDNSRNGLPYQTIMVNGRLLYYLGWGSSILALPGVAALNALGISTLGPGGSYDWHGELRIERPLAAAIAAGVTWETFCLGSLIGLPTAWAAAIALALAFGTQVWSGASRALWPQTWLLLLVTTAIWLLVKWERGEGHFRPMLMASLLSWMYFVRPASASEIIVISLYVLVAYPSKKLAFFGTGMAWFGSFIAFSFYFFRAPLPPYYHELGLLSLHDFFRNLAGLLVSPSRGILIFCPLVLFALCVPLLYWKHLEHKRLALTAYALIVVELAMLSSFRLWWGGWSYGPREMTDAIPFFALLAILGSKALLADHSLSVRKRRALIATGIVLVISSASINAPGALSEQAFAWNAWADVDYHPARLWDWRRAQFLAPFLKTAPKHWRRDPVN